MSAQSRLTIVPCELADANLFIREHHRHHGAMVHHRFSLAVCDEDGTVCGVAIVDRPAARALSDGWTLEARRVATDGFPNACSALYGACWRATKALGYRRLVTYTLASESGASLRGAGWRVVGEVRGREWDCPSRPRARGRVAQLELKLRWQAPDGAGDPA